MPVKEVSWEKKVTALFVERRAAPYPALWEAGHYPTGEEDYPVGGVSWYEAAAYALSVGRARPTIYHWRRRWPRAPLPGCCRQAISTARGLRPSAPFLESVGPAIST